MKTIATITTLFTILLTATAGARPLNYRIDCTGYTKKQEKFDLTVIYNMDEDEIKCEDPCTEILDSRPVLIDLSMTYKGQVATLSHSDFNQVEMYITADQTTYRFYNKDNKQAEYVEIIPAPADVDKEYDIDEFSYLLKGSKGKFKYGQCEFAAPEEDL